MATVDNTYEGRDLHLLSDEYGPNTGLTTWEALGNGDDGAAALHGGFSDRTIQFVGTWGTGGSAQLEGSNDGTNWEILTGPDGTDLIFTADGLRSVMEATKYVRPNVTNGDGTTDIDAYLFSRG